MPTERKRAIRTTTAWNADQAAMEALYGVNGYYTSLSLWEAGEQANLTTLDEIRTAVCYNDWPSGLSDELDINGWTTDATRYVRVTVAEGHRHNGTPGSGFHLRKSSSGSSMVLNRHRYTSIEWLDTEQLSTGTLKYCFRAFLQPDVLFYACIGRTQTSTTTLGAFNDDNSGVSSAVMCFAYGSPVGITSVVARNCVVANCTTGFGGSGGRAAYNCVAYNCTTDYAPAWGFGEQGSNNASSGTGATGASPQGGGVNSITSAAFVDAANNDFHLTSGSVLRGAGVNLYSDFTTDIDGDTWPSSDAWDIGFDYYVAAGGSLTIDSITASNITSSGARITLGVTR